MPAKLFHQTSVLAGTPMLVLEQTVLIQLCIITQQQCWRHSIHVLVSVLVDLIKELYTQQEILLKLVLMPALVFHQTRVLAETPMLVLEQTVSIQICTITQQQCWRHSIHVLVSVLVDLIEEMHTQQEILLKLVLMPALVFHQTRVLAETPMLVLEQTVSIQIRITIQP
jgi:fructose-bisphosphate aldolase class 1